MDVLLQLSSALAAILICGIGGAVAFGRIKGSMITRAEYERRCQERHNTETDKIEKKMDEVKDLVIDLHEKQTKRIGDLDEKLNSTKDDWGKELMEISKFMGKVDAYLSGGVT